MMGTTFQKKEFQKLEEEYKNIRWTKGSYPAIGIGWTSLIKEYIQKLSDLLGPCRAGTILQIKEKFGRLIIYDLVNPSVIDEAEEIKKEISNRSIHTCEFCGNPAVIQNYKGGYWQKCVCKECNE